MARFNFEGWELKKWAAHNKETIKLVLVFLVGYNYLSGFSWQSFAVGLGALLGKLVIDSFDYWVSK